MSNWNTLPGTTPPYLDTETGYYANVNEKAQQAGKALTDAAKKNRFSIWELFGKVGEHQDTVFDLFSNLDGLFGGDKAKGDKGNPPPLPEKDNTILYVGGGVLLLILVVMMILIFKK